MGPGNGEKDIGITGGSSKMGPGNGEKVTISDCGRALESIRQELEQLAKQKTELSRKEAALRTQALVINELVRRIA